MNLVTETKNYQKPPDAKESDNIIPDGRMHAITTNVEPQPNSSSLIKRIVEGFFLALLPPLSLIHAVTHHRKFDSKMQLWGGLGSLIGFVGAAALPIGFYFFGSVSKFFNVFPDLEVASIVALYAFIMGCAMVGRGIGFLMGYARTASILSENTPPITKANKEAFKASIGFMLFGSAFRKHFYTPFTYHLDTGFEDDDQDNLERILTQLDRVDYFRSEVIRGVNFNSLVRLQGGVILKQLIAKDVASLENSSHARVLLSGPNAPQLLAKIIRGNELRVNGVASLIKALSEYPWFNINGLDEHINPQNPEKCAYLARILTALRGTGLLTGEGGAENFNKIIAKFRGFSANESHAQGFENARQFGLLDGRNNQRNFDDIVSCHPVTIPNIIHAFGVLPDLLAPEKSEIRREIISKGYSAISIANLMSAIKSCNPALYTPENFLLALRADSQDAITNSLRNSTLISSQHHSVIDCQANLATLIATESQAPQAADLLSQLEELSVSLVNPKTRRQIIEKAFYDPIFISYRNKSGNLGYVASIIKQLKDSYRLWTKETAEFYFTAIMEQAHHARSIDRALAYIVRLLDLKNQPEKIERVFNNLVKNAQFCEDFNQACVFIHSLKSNSPSTYLGEKDADLCVQRMYGMIEYSGEINSIFKHSGDLFFDGGHLYYTKKKKEDANLKLDLIFSVLEKAAENTLRESKETVFDEKLTGASKTSTGKYKQNSTLLNEVVILLSKLDQHVALNKENADWILENLAAIGPFNNILFLAAPSSSWGQDKNQLFNLLKAFKNVNKGKLTEIIQSFEKVIELLKSEELATNNFGTMCDFINYSALFNKKLLDAKEHYPPILEKMKTPIFIDAEPKPTEIPEGTIAFYQSVKQVTAYFMEDEKKCKTIRFKSEEISEPLKTYQSLTPAPNNDMWRRGYWHRICSICRKALIQEAFDDTVQSLRCREAFAAGFHKRLGKDTPYNRDQLGVKTLDLNAFRLALDFLDGGGLRELKQGTTSDVISTPSSVSESSTALISTIRQQDYNHPLSQPRSMLTNSSPEIIEDSVDSSPSTVC